MKFKRFKGPNPFEPKPERQEVVPLEDVPEGYTRGSEPLVDERFRVDYVLGKVDCANTYNDLDPKGRQRANALNRYRGVVVKSLVGHFGDIKGLRLKLVGSGNGKARVIEVLYFNQRVSSLAEYDKIRLRMD